jgi:hypothetical protein
MMVIFVRESLQELDVVVTTWTIHFWYTCCVPHSRSYEFGIGGNEHVWSNKCRRAYRVVNIIYQWLFSRYDMVGLAMLRDEIPLEFRCFQMINWKPTIPVVD